MKKVAAKATNKTISKATTRKKQSVAAVKNVKGKKNSSAQVVIQNKLNYIPKVSVIIPVYNVEKYLRECLDSVVNQTLKEIEVICVDDGSTDNSLEILKEYAKKDNRITVVSRENKGVGYSRNQAIKLSKGEFIAFMDPDDYYPSKEVLSVLYSAATNNDVQISGGSLIVYDENLQKEIKRTDFYNFFDKNKLVNYTDFQYDYGYQRFIFDRQMLIKNNVFFPEYKRFQDPPFMVNAFICAERFYAVSDYTYAYRWAHQIVNWTEEKVFHLLSGLCDDLNMAITNNLEKLYDLTLMRIKKDYKAVITGQSSDRINQIKQGIMDICLTQTSKRYKKDLKKYKVSVVLPIYNAEPYLRECLDSVVNQTLKDIEIICVNDGSTDNSLDIIKEYANKDKRIKYIDKPNAGYGQTMNCGIDLARGEYIGIVEPDDFIKPDMYETLYDKASRNNLDITKCNISPFRETKGAKRFETVNYLKDIEKYNKVYTPYELQEYMMHWHCTTTAIYNTKLIKENNIRYNETPGAAYQDTSFWFKTHCMAQTIMCIDKSGYMYRQGAENQSTTNFNQFSSLLYEYKTIYDFIVKNNLQKYIPLYLYKKFKSCCWYYSCAPKNIKKYMIEKIHEELSYIWEYYKNLDLTVYFNDEEKKQLNKFISSDYKNIFSDDFKYEIIISLTSYPERIGTVNQTIETLLNQTQKADKVILWLAPEQFPNREADLPQQLLDLRSKGLTIDWYHDIKSYKKLIPALQKYPDAIIVTADDDIIYDKDWLNKLVVAYEKDSSVIWAHRAHRVNEYHVCEYNKWIHCISERFSASYNNFCTTGGGVLYPPHCFYKDVSNESKFMTLCPTGDDIWFWAMLILNHKKIKIVNSPDRYIKTIDGTQEDCLWSINYLQNDKQLKKIISEYPKIKKLLHMKRNTKSYLLFPYYGFANLWMKIVSIPLAKFKKHTKQVLYSHSARGRMDMLNVKIERLVQSIRIDMQHQIESVKTDVKQQIESVKTDVMHQIESVKTDMKQLVQTSEKNTVNTVGSMFNTICKKMDNNFVTIHERLLSVTDFKRALEIWYRSKTGHRLNLENPRTFNKKIQWLKLYDSTPTKTKLADKYLVRDWVAEKIGEQYLIPLLGVYDSFDEIDFDKLPNQFVIKCNHGCGYNYIVKDKSKLDLTDVRNKINTWMRENFAYRAGYELHYRDIEPKIIIEKFIENKNSDDLNDYKFYCFNGKVKYIQVISERTPTSHKVSFYDTKWQKQTWWDNIFYEGEVKAPKRLNEMIKLAEKLCKGFCFVRVDLYYLDTDDIYFGEMTFTPGSGIMKWSSESINTYLGKLISLPKKMYDVMTDEYYKIPND